MASSDNAADVEKGIDASPRLASPIKPAERNSGYDPTLDIHDELKPRHKFFTWTDRIERLLGFEARGIHRVKEQEQTEKTTLNFIQIVMMWFSINAAVQNITLASIGQSVYELGFVDATLCSVFGGILGCMPVAYTAGWGPWSGNRTLICARFSMGWWPVKLCVLLNLVILIGYSMIDAVIAGQMLSAVSANGDLSVEVGIVITAVITLIVTTFGIKIFHHFERWAWVLSLTILLILLGTTAKHYDTSTPSVATGRTLIGNRLSFFSVCLSAAVTYAPGAADFLVYCNPTSATRWKVGLATFIGLSLSFSLCFIIGAGLSSGIASQSSWEAAGAGSGALIVAGYGSLGGFGKFCSVLAALGLIPNMVAPIYSSGIDFQVLGRYTAMIPRFMWNILAVVIFTVCALAGKNSLSEIFTNFLALMGYWVVLWISITLLEHLLFRRIFCHLYTGSSSSNHLSPLSSRAHPFNWQDWNIPSHLPIGLAAITAFCVGWVGAILCMAQFYYVGPLAKTVGEFGADMGNYVGFAWAGLVFVPLRWLELRKFGR